MRAMLNLLAGVQFGGDEVVKAKDGAGSATLSMAYAGFRYASFPHSGRDDVLKFSIDSPRGSSRPLKARRVSSSPLSSTSRVLKGVTRSPKRLASISSLSPLSWAYAFLVLRNETQY